ncbi:ATP synthase subunit I [Flexistipes sp.]|uniref:ATP synthase subunit I n=1 Tax=Flexistipes sp. TaxID=3088135 RepID=UPI002E1FDE97|nr:ATP synthase subunit I [Flexistipes sp.]
MIKTIKTMRIKKIVIISLIFFVILYTVFKIFYSGTFALSLAAGWAVSFGNFIGLAFKLKSTLNGGYAKALVFNSQFRLLLTGILLFAFFKNFEVSYIGLLTGLLINAISIPVGGILELRRDTDGTPT